MCCPGCFSSVFTALSAVWEMKVSFFAGKKHQTVQNDSSLILEMVHLKIHFSVRAEYKKKTQRKALTIQCGHLCTHTTEHYLFLTTQGWLHTDISMTPGWFFMITSIWSFKIWCKAPQQVILNWSTACDMIIPFIRWCNSTDMLFRVWWAWLFLLQRDTKLLSSLFIPFILIMHKNCTIIYGSEPLKMIINSYLKCCH